MFTANPGRASLPLLVAPVREVVDGYEEQQGQKAEHHGRRGIGGQARGAAAAVGGRCLLYTSEAADE